MRGIYGPRGVPLAVLNPQVPPDEARQPTVLGPDDRKWLHDKYERLAAEEGQLATSRTSYYAAIGTVLVTAILVAIADLSFNRLLLAGVATFLASLGILISFVWAVLLHRTNDAQMLWREAAEQLEGAQPPLDGNLPSRVSLRSHETIPVNLLRPYQTHRERFRAGYRVSWMDGVNPATLTEVLPVAFLVIWISAVIFVWAWLLV
jgi:hypothetical protein